MLHVRKFSVMTASTSAVRQIRRAPLSAGSFAGAALRAGCPTGANGRESCASVTSVPLFFPGVAAQVVAVRFPEAGLVSLYEAKPAHPLCRLPEIQVRDQQANGATMLRRQGR